MKLTVLTAFIIIIVALVIFAPLATIWALNTLFTLGIAYTWQTWLSVIVLNITVLGGLSSQFNKSSK